MSKAYHLDNNYITKPLKCGKISLLQIGRQYCKEKFGSQEHIHMQYFELTVITGGKGCIITNDTSSNVERGDIYLSLPYEKHEITSDIENPLKFDFLAFSCEDEKFNQELDLLIENHHSTSNRIFQDERISAQIGNIISELSRDRIFSDTVITASLNQIIVYIIRHFQKIPAQKLSSVVTKPEIICYQLMHYIDTHIYSLKNLKELSDVTDYSYGYISSIFKKTTSQTLSHYYNSKKAEVSRLLLLENRMSITEISEQLNFSTVYAFSKAFKARFGISPRDYRKKSL